MILILYIAMWYLHSSLYIIFLNKSIWDKNASIIDIQLDNKMSPINKGWKKRFVWGC